MNRDKRHTHVEIDVDGHVVATADVEVHDERGVVRASLQAEPGHQPIGSRARLVDAVLDLPEAHDQRRLEATVPIGDTEMLERLRQQCDDVQTRPAGATSIVDADIPETRLSTQPHSPASDDPAGGSSPRVGPLPAPARGVSLPRTHP